MKDDYCWELTKVHIKAGINPVFDPKEDVFKIPCDTTDTIYILLMDEDFATKDDIISYRKFKVSEVNSGVNDWAIKKTEENGLEHKVLQM